MMRPRLIIIHHSLTPDGHTLSWPAIVRYHTRTKGWRDVGYHAGIEDVGGSFVCCYGRPVLEPGAHTLGQNGHSLGFCFVGDFDYEPPGGRRLREAARRVLAPWCAHFDLTPDAIRPHRDYAEKSCPGDAFDMDALRAVVAEELSNLN